MLKRYKKKYKKMQKQRRFDKTILFFQNWTEKKSIFFKYLFFIFIYKTLSIKLKFVKKFKKRFRKRLKKKKIIFNVLL